jgi:hypothetical protein
MRGSKRWLLPALFVPDFGKLTVSLTFTQRDEAGEPLHAEYEAVVASLRPGKKAP